MKFNVSYEIISFVVLLIVTFRYYNHMHFPAFSNRIFGFLLVIGNFNLIVDIVSSYFINNPGTAPVGMMYIINSLYYITQFIMPASLLLFVISLIAVRRKVDIKYFYLSIIPAIIFILVFLIELPNGKIFTISQSFEYGYGSLSHITYICAGIYFAVTIFISFYRKDLLTNNEFYSLLLLYGLSILAIILQFIFPTELLTGCASAVGFMIMFFTIQDPQYYLDPVTNIFTGEAMMKLFDYRYSRKTNFSLAIIVLHDLHNIHMLYGRNAGNAALINLGDFLLRYENAWSFRAGDSLFLTSFKTNEELDEFVKDFDQFRNLEQTCDSVTLMPKYTLLCIKDTERFKNTRELMAVVENLLDDSNIDPIKLKTTYLSETRTLKCINGVAIEEAVKEDLPNGDNFFVLYQPIYSIKKKKYVSLESLTRFKTDSLGLIKPSDFIPIIEQKGLAIQFDNVVVKKVFEDISSGIFDKLGLHSIHINLSASSFTSKESIRSYIKLAKKLKVDPKFITFEITETASVPFEDLIKETSKMLRDAGFGLALDDFGTGYANIKRVVQLPFTHVKLDKIFVQDTPVFVKDIIKLFRDLNMEIVAEGVETKQHQKLIEDNNVDLIQGFYYSKPITAQEIVELLKKK